MFASDEDGRRGGSGGLLHEVHAPLAVFLAETSRPALRLGGGDGRRVPVHLYALDLEVVELLFAFASRNFDAFSQTS